MISYRWVSFDGHEVFYREAGDRQNLTVLLLHGFPSSSYMFRNLIPRLATEFHVVAPDLPGFGFTRVWNDFAYEYTFDNLASVVARFLDVLNLVDFAMYVFDYGAPVGFRIALERPERVKAIISQSGNAYEEGLSERWSPVQRYWSEPTAANRGALRQLLTEETTKWQYLHGVADPSLVAPEAYTLDHLLMRRQGNDEIQLNLFLDYAYNVALYPAIQRYFAQHQPPLLAVWGRNDPFFLPAGAEAFKRDLPRADVQFLEAGHFALETHVEQIGREISRFLNGPALQRSIRPLPQIPTR